MKKAKIKIMVFGTFDGLHRGHLNFFKQARSLATEPFLIVSVARDKNVTKIKGQRPFFSEKKRMALIKNLIKKDKLVDKAVLSGIKDHIPHIIKERPDIIALGYDQRAYVPHLKKDLKNKGAKGSGGISVKLVRLKPYKEKVYKNKLLHAKMHHFIKKGRI